MKSIQGTDLTPTFIVLHVSLTIIGLVIAVFCITEAIQSQQAIAQTENQQILVVTAEDGTCLVTRNTEMYVHQSFTKILDVWGETDYKFSASTNLSWIHTYKPWQWAAERLGADPESCEGDATLD